MTVYPEVAVVILNWNGRPFLERFIPFVLASTYPNLRVIVADNASSDDSLLFLEAKYPQVERIRNSVNLGFAGGYNEALKSVKSDYLVLLNSDVEVTTGWIEPVIELMESDPLIAVAQPKLLDYNNRLLFEYAGAAGGYIDTYGYPFCRGRVFDTREADEGQYNDVAEVFWASGAALFIKRRCWEQATGFDADFFAHMEEIDLCWRLKNMGYKVMYCPRSVVYHIGGGTLQSESPYKTFLNFRNNLAMLLKNLPAGKAAGVIFVRFWLDLLALLKFLAAGKLKHAWSVSKAHQAFFTGFRSNRKKLVKDFSRANLSGLYRGSIVWQYFVKKKKIFRNL